MLRQGGNLVNNGGYKLQVAGQNLLCNLQPELYTRRVKKAFRGRICRFKKCLYLFLKKFEVLQRGYHHSR